MVYRVREEEEAASTWRATTALFCLPLPRACLYQQPDDFWVTGFPSVLKRRATRVVQQIRIRARREQQTHNFFFTGCGGLGQGRGSPINAPSVGRCSRREQAAHFAHVAYTGGVGKRLVQHKFLTYEEPTKQDEQPQPRQPEPVAATPLAAPQRVEQYPRRVDHKGQRRQSQHDKSARVHLYKAYRSSPNLRSQHAAAKRFQLALQPRKARLVRAHAGNRAA